MLRRWVDVQGWVLRNVKASQTSATVSTRTFVVTRVLGHIPLPCYTAEELMPQRMALGQYLGAAAGDRKASSASSGTLRDHPYQLHLQIALTSVEHSFFGLLSRATENSSGDQGADRRTLAFSSIA